MPFGVGAVAVLCPFEIRGAKEAEGARSQFAKCWNPDRNVQMMLKNMASGWFNVCD